MTPTPQATSPSDPQLDLDILALGRMADRKRETALVVSNGDMTALGQKTADQAEKDAATLDRAAALMRAERERLLNVEVG